MSTPSHPRPTPEFVAGIALALLAALVACGVPAPRPATPGPGTTASPTPDPDAPLVVTWWNVTALTTGAAGPSVPAEGTRAARFTLAADGAASGTLGCNRFNARATVDGSSVTFGPLTTTRMACPGPAGEAERALTGLFGAGPLTWGVRGRTLTLTAPDGTGLSAEASSSVE
ncbi:META domain-containing protein [Streptomyces sp. NPDC051567]|uniref:META domain-containing protein n=1 Tax=Streptomyces sp. NPDC051567 TaxID=3365660 RepID=UPI00379EF851